MTLWFRVQGSPAVEVHLCSEAPQDVDGDFAIIPAGMVCSRRMVEIALERTLRAIKSGIARARNPSREFLRYISGERQISKAMARMAYDGGDAVVIVFDGTTECSSTATVECPYETKGMVCSQCPRRVWERWGVEWTREWPFEKYLVERGAFVALERDL